MMIIDKQWRWQMNMWTYQLEEPGEPLPHGTGAEKTTKKIRLSSHTTQTQTGKIKQIPSWPNLISECYFFLQISSCRFNNEYTTATKVLCLPNVHKYPDSSLGFILCTLLPAQRVLTSSILTLSPTFWWYTKIWHGGATQAHFSRSTYIQTHQLLDWAENQDAQPCWVSKTKRLCMAGREVVTASLVLTLARMLRKRQVYVWVKKYKVSFT